MSEEKFRPYVPETTKMTEFTLRAVVLGLIMTVILGAANAYLGLRAGMTIAATYPAAVISMAILRLFRGSILEENIARTVGSIGESVAAGAIFTIPAFVQGAEAAGRGPRGGAQARAAGGAEPGRGREEQRLRDADGSGDRRRVRRGDLHSRFHRQSRESVLRHGGKQTGM